MALCIYQLGTLGRMTLVRISSPANRQVLLELDVQSGNRTAPELIEGLARELSEVQDTETRPGKVLITVHGRKASELPGYLQELLGKLAKQTLMHHGQTSPRLKQDKPAKPRSTPPAASSVMFRAAAQ